MKRITVTLTEDQHQELIALVIAKKVKLATDILASTKPDRRTDEQAFIKRLETTLAQAKS